MELKNRVEVNQSLSPGLVRYRTNLNTIITKIILINKMGSFLFSPTIKNFGRNFMKQFLTGLTPIDQGVF